jgi:hypothetical protein
MTAPPLPASPCLRCRLIYSNSDASEAGSRFYLAYAGAAPTPGNCSSIAEGIEAAWVAGPLAMIHTDWALTEVDVLDITTDTGASGQWTGSEAGTYAGSIIPASAATNVEFDIARRYRGGKPRMFWPPPSSSALLDAGHWTTAFLTQAASNNATFWNDVTAIDVGAVGALTHVNLSYYKGFTNVTNSSGRTRAAPMYRDTALVDNVEGYAVKAEIGSQRRRRIATSP